MNTTISHKTTLSKESSIGSVAAVVVAYNRKDTLEQVIRHLLNQTHPVDEIIVVDNNSTDGTGDMVTKEFPQATYLGMSENLGSAGGMVQGMKRAYQNGHDWLWLWEDDTVADPETLEHSLDTFNSLNDPKVGVVHAWGSVRGKATPRAALWRGKYQLIRHEENGEPYDVDIVCNTGNLISRRVIDTVGFPRDDYFMMWSEIAYGLAIRSAGFRIVSVPKVMYEHIKPPTSTYPAPWRGYYQTRNQLSHALERRSLRELLWWGQRQVKFTTHALLHYDAKFTRLRLRFLGAWHGLRGKMGRTIDPSAFASANRN